jgi:ParB-like chromosome segregation protein Spo0J
MTTHPPMAEGPRRRRPGHASETPTQLEASASHGIIPDLEPLAVPIGDLKPLPGNPRRGDIVAVAGSYRRFGQRKPLVARRDGTVISGNHQLEAARGLGWTHVAVVWTDDDDTTGRAFALADNRTSDLGTYDTEALTNLLLDVRNADIDLYHDTAYDDKALADLLMPKAKTRRELLDEAGGVDQSGELEFHWAVIIECAGEAEQAALLERFSNEGLQCRALIS